MFDDGPRRLMERADHRPTILLGEGNDHPTDVARGRRVQARRRFVYQHDTFFREHVNSDGDTFPLPS